MSSTPLRGRVAESPIPDDPYRASRASPAHTFSRSLYDQSVAWLKDVARHSFSGQDKYRDRNDLSQSRSQDSHTPNKDTATRIDSFLQDGALSQNPVASVPSSGIAARHPQHQRQNPYFSALYREYDRLREVVQLHDAECVAHELNMALAQADAPRQSVEEAVQRQRARLQHRVARLSASVYTHRRRWRQVRRLRRHMRHTASSDAAPAAAAVAALSGKREPFRCAHVNRCNKAQQHNERRAAPPLDDAKVKEREGGGSLVDVTQEIAALLGGQVDAFAAAQDLMTLYAQRHTRQTRAVVCALHAARKQHDDRVSCDGLSEARGRQEPPKERFGDTAVRAVVRVRPSRLADLESGRGATSPHLCQDDTGNDANDNDVTNGNTSTTGSTHGMCFGSGTTCGVSHDASSSSTTMMHASDDASEAASVGQDDDHLAALTVLSESPAILQLRGRRYTADAVYDEVGVRSDRDVVHRCRVQGRTPEKQQRAQQQRTLFATELEPLLCESCVTGRSLCVMVTGVSGAGKTYTLLGESCRGVPMPHRDAHATECDGLLPRALAWLHARFAVDRMDAVCAGARHTTEALTDGSERWSACGTPLQPPPPRQRSVCVARREKDGRGAATPHGMGRRELGVVPVLPAPVLQPYASCSSASALLPCRVRIVAMRISVVEVYNDAVCDLLDDGACDGANTTCLRGGTAAEPTTIAATRLSCEPSIPRDGELPDGPRVCAHQQGGDTNDPRDDDLDTAAMRIVRRALRRRRTCGTARNAASSRGHVIITLHLTVLGDADPHTPPPYRHRSPRVKHGSTSRTSMRRAATTPHDIRMTFVDLAGAEGVAVRWVCGPVLRETRCIHRGLAALDAVLTDGHACTCRGHSGAARATGTHTSDEEDEEGGAPSGSSASTRMDEVRVLWPAYRPRHGMTFSSARPTLCLPRPRPTHESTTTKHNITVTAKPAWGHLRHGARAQHAAQAPPSWGDGPAADPAAPHYSFRANPLTRTLQSALRASGVRLLLIGCVTPCDAGEVVFAHANGKPIHCPRDQVGRVARLLFTVQSSRLVAEARSTLALVTRLREERGEHQEGVE